MKKYFTSESVTEGHPDKVCDRISDEILDEILRQDPYARVACETCATTGMILIMGEVTTTARVDYAKIARKAVNDIGYTSDAYGFNGDTCSVMVALDEQSSDIALGVDNDGAGDQGLMFGYACDETASLMPMPVFFAHELAKRLTYVRKEGILPYLRPDGKTQVTVEYDNEAPVRVESVVVSSQHDGDVSMGIIRGGIIDEVIKKVIPVEYIDENTKIYVNPTGRFVVGGPHGDSGLTGRKIIVDTYGGYARHGGGAFSGKDPTKVDRSASYMARYIAKNIVAAGFAKKCEVQLAYAIGVAEPVSVMLEVETYNTGCVEDEVLAKAVRSVFGLTPKKIIETLELRRPIYAPLSAYGQIGREDLGVKWEKTDMVDALKEAVGCIK